MSDFDWEQPEGFDDGGNFLKTDGTFHCAVQDVVTQSKDGGMLDGFRVTLEVLDGTPRNSEGCTETKKIANVTFFNGKLNHKDRGEFARKRQAAFFVAANVLTTIDIDAIRQRKPSVNLRTAIGKQIVISLGLNENNYVEIDGASVWHVDDPASASFPKAADALKLIHKDLRRTPEELQQIKDAFAGESASKTGGNGNGSARATEPAGAGVDLDDI